MKTDYKKSIIIIGVCGFIREIESCEGKNQNSFLLD